MVVVFAKDLELRAPAGTTVEVLSEPVPLGEHDFALAIGNASYLAVVGDATPSVTAQVSDDGTTWTDTSLTFAWTGAGAVQGSGEVHGKYLRFKLELLANAFDAIVSIDLPVRLGRVSLRSGSFGRRSSWLARRIEERRVRRVQYQSGRL